MLGHEHQRLAVEPVELHDRADEAPGTEIEGHNVVFPHAVQASAWPESQSPRPAESGGGPRCEDPHELPGHRIIFTHAGHGVRTLIWNQRHLMTVLREYEDFCNTHRLHRTLNQASPLRPLPDSLTDLDHFRVRRRDRTGGVIHEYRLVA